MRRGEVRRKKKQCRGEHRRGKKKSKAVGKEEKWEIRIGGGRREEMKG